MLKSLRLPHPIVLLLGAVMFAALLTWVLPAGEYSRTTDAATGRQVVVAGTYHNVQSTPVGALAAVAAIPRGFIEGGDGHWCGWHSDGHRCWRAIVGA